MPARTLLLAAAGSGRLKRGHLEGTVFSGSARYYLRHWAKVSSFLGLWVDRGTGLDGDASIRKVQFLIETRRSF